MEQFPKELQGTWHSTDKPLWKSQTYSVHKYPMKLKRGLIMTLFHNFFRLSNWSEKLKNQLLIALYKGKPYL